MDKMVNSPPHYKYGKKETIDVIKDCMTNDEYHGYLKGNIISKEAEDLHARIVQHEFDHLKGILYTRRIAHKDAFGFEDEIEKYWKQNEENKNEIS